MIVLSPTGGTTGMPKGVMNTHRSVQTFFAHFMMGCTYPADVTPVNLAAAPMTHTAGLLSVPCTAQGGTVVIVTKPDPALLLEAIQTHRVTEFFLPPTVIYRLLDIPDLEQESGLLLAQVPPVRRRADVGGEAEEGHRGLRARDDGRLRPDRGTAIISFLRPDEHLVDGQLAADARLSSVGRPNPLIRVEIMNDANEILPRGETGEICVRGDLVMKGYYKAPDKTAETIVDGWLHTGDIGHLDAEGYLHITDRKKDMIITGGFNVYPSEVEQVIWSHPAVQDCAVIGVPDEQWGEAVKAVVELNPGQSVAADELIALCKEQARQRDGAEERRLHRQPAAQPGRQGAQEGPAQAVLAGRRPQDLSAASVIRKHTENP